MDTPMKLTVDTWLVEEAEKTEEVVSFLRSRLGTYSADLDPTTNFFRGYEAALKSAIRQRDL